MKKKNFKKSAKSCNELVSGQIAELMYEGELMGNEMINVMALNGTSPAGLVTEVYAAAKVWGMLRAICNHKRFNPDELFNGLVPLFEEEGEQILNEGNDEILN